MNDDFRKGFVTGLAMNPLYVVEQQSSDSGKQETICEACAIGAGTVYDDTRCVFINMEDI